MSNSDRLNSTARFTVTAVPDPYHDGSFDRALDLIETAVDGLLDAIEAQRLQ